MKPMKMLRHTAWAQAITLAALLPGLVFLPNQAMANPSGATITHGDVEIDMTNPAHLMILQSSDKAIINWEDFSIAPGEITQFAQPGAGSVALNRVTGGNVSALMGTLQANGGVILVNPNGILVGAGGVVDIGGLTILSTLDIDDADFLDGGDMRFYGSSAAGVTNLGTITSRGGDVVLLGNFVDNAGAVGAPDGTVAFGAGGEFIVDTIGDSRISVVAGGPGGEKGITNSGTVTANSVEFKAHGNVYALAIQNTGIVRATAVNRSGGRITLSAAGDGTVGGRIENTGTLQARGLGGVGGEILIDAGIGGVIDNVDGTIDADGDGGQDGGTITMLGDVINIIGNSKVSADGANGGFIQIGSPDQTSSITVGGDSSVSANGVSGAGGTVLLQGTPSSVINVEGTVTADGSGAGGFVGIEGGTVNAGANSVISATGGGDGGLVTINGATAVNTDGAIRASSAGGAGGQVLINGAAINSGADSVMDVSGITDGGLIDIEATGATNLGGDMDASANAGVGGRIDATGATVNIGNQAAIDASGGLGGGEVNLGGGLRGMNSGIANSQSTVIGEDVRINVDSDIMGNAGNAVVWSDGSTFFQGHISARARGIVGNGGLVEVSGYEDLYYRGSVDTRAENGANGILLLDPTDVTIGPAAGGATLTDVALVQAVLLNNVIIHTSGAGTAAGDIIIEAGSDVQYDSPNSLAFFAHRHIFVNGDVKNHGTKDTAFAGTGNITLVAGWDGTGAVGSFDPDNPAAPGAGSVVTAADVLAGTYGTFGNDNGDGRGSIFINDAAAEPVEVGSARGETNAFADNVLITSGDGGGEFSQFGYRRENDLRAYALNGLGANGVVGGGDDTYTQTGLDLDFDTGVTGNINIYANGSVLAVQHPGVNNDEGIKNTDRAYVMIGHGGIRENNNDIDNRGNQTNDALAQSGGVPGNAAGIDYGSDSGDVSVGNGDNHGDITVQAGNIVYLQAGRAESHAMIGHGGLGNDDPDANGGANTVSDRGNIGNNNFRAVHIFGNMTGDITVQAGFVDLEGGRYNDAFVQIGHGGTRVRGEHGGEISVVASTGDITARAAPDSATGGPANSNDWRWRNNRDQSHAQIGHGGFDSDFIFLDTLGATGTAGGEAGNGSDAYDTNGAVNRPDDADAVFMDANPRRSVALSTRDGDEVVANSSRPGDGISINRVRGRFNDADGVTGESFGHFGDITVTANGSVNFTAANGNDGHAMIGHGGRSTVGDHNGNVSVTAQNGSVIFTREAWQVNERGRDISNRGVRAHVQIGHGGSLYNGGATGNIDVSAAEDIEFYGGRSQAYAMIGHGGRGADNSTWNSGRQRNEIVNGTHSGNINVNAGGNVKFRSGFAEEQAHSKIGHGGYYQHADVVDNLAYTQTLFGDRPVDVTGEGHNGDIVVNAGGGISFIAGQTEALSTQQNGMERNGNDNFTMIGHGGRFSKGDHYGNIDVTSGGNLDLEARGGWDAVTIENNAGDNNTNRIGTPRLNQAEDNGRTGIRNFALIGHGGHDAEHRNDDNSDGWNNSGKNGDGLGVAGESNITVNAGGDVNVLAAMQATTVDKPLPIRILQVNGNGNQNLATLFPGITPNFYTVEFAAFTGDVQTAGGAQNFVIEHVGNGSVEPGDLTGANAAEGDPTEIVLNFDGATTVQQAIDAWNADVLNSEFQIALRNGDGSQTPLNGESMAFANGQAAVPTDEIGTTYSQFHGRLEVINRNDGERWDFPDPVLSAEDSFAQIGTGGRATDYRGSGGSIVSEGGGSGAGTAINPVDGLGHRGDVSITAGGNVRVEASDIKQAVSGDNETDGNSGQRLGIAVTQNFRGNAGGNATNGSNTYYVGPGIGANNQSGDFINGDNNQNDPTQGTRNYAMIGLGGDTARGDHSGSITIMGGGDLDLIAGEGRQAFAQIGSGGYDSDRLNTDGAARENDTGATTTITIDIDGKLTMKGGGLQNGDTTGMVAVLDVGGANPGEIVNPSNPDLNLDNTDATRGSYVQIGSGGASNGGNHHADIDITTGTGAELEAGNLTRQSGYGIIGSGGTWGRSAKLSGNVSLVAETGDITIKAGTPVQDTEDDPNSGPANGPNLSDPVYAVQGPNVMLGRESYFQIGNGGWDTDFQSGGGNAAGFDAYNGDITVIAAEGSISLTAGGDDVLNNTRDASHNPNNSGGNGSDRGRGLYVLIGNGGPFNGGDSTGDIRVSAGTDLNITGGRGGEVNFAQIGHGGNSDSGNNTGLIDIEVGNDLTLQYGSREDAKGDLVRDAFAKIGHTHTILDGGGQGDFTGDREGDITVSVGNDMITLNGVDADGDTNERGPIIGHIDFKRDGVPIPFLALGDTLLAVSRNDPTAGTGGFNLSPGTVITSADGGLATSELRLYMPNPGVNAISDGAFLNSADYTRIPAPGSGRSDELIATEHTLTTGIYNEPVGDFDSPPEGDYIPSGFGLYNIYYADLTPVVPPVVAPPAVGAPAPEIIEEVIVIPEFVFFAFPFLAQAGDKFDSYDRDNFRGFINGALYSIFGLTANEEYENSKPKPPRVPGDEILEEPTGLATLAPAQTDEEKEEEEEKSGNYLLMGEYPYNFFWALPISEEGDGYSSFQEFGLPIQTGTPPQQP